MRPFALVALLSVGVATWSCDKSSSESPASPSNPNPPQLNLSGTWTGTMTSSNFPRQQITLQLTQFQSGVTGVYRLTPNADYTGSIGTGSMNGGAFTGTLFLNAGSPCQSHGEFSGTVTETELHWTSSGFQGVAVCTIGPPPKNLPQRVSIDATR
jgi:hypothetical protein